jgi:Virulence-associated protein E/Bifunctional DNA primase/polymerase, N-terminal
VIAFDPNNLPDSPLAWALAYAQDGMAVFPVGSDKRPLVPHGLKAASTDQAQIKTWWRKWPHADVGATVPEGVAILDFDCTKGKNGRAAYQRLENIDPESLEAPMTTTPSGGLHVWTSTNGRRLKQATGYEAEGVDVRLGGRGYVVLPGANNGRWWLKPLSTPMPPTQVWVNEESETTSASSSSQPTGKTTPYGRKALDNACAKIRDAAPGERDAAIGKVALKIGSLIGGGEINEAEALGQLLASAMFNGGGFAEQKAKIERAVASGRQHPKSARQKATNALPPWLATCEKDDRDRIIPNLANLMIALRLDPALADAFAFDQMLQAPVLRCALPSAPNGRTTGGTDPLPRPLRDADISDLREYVQHHGFPRIGRDVSHEAVDKRAREHSFHPVQQWLDALVWDGTARLDGWLATYLGSTGDSAYLAAIGSMFLISMVARIYRPGCKVDYMLVLEGDQGAAKSQACAILAGEWFSDAMPDIRHKDASQHHRGKWLIELSELSAFTRADVEALKAFITRDTERYRPPYGRLEVIEPRQSVFVGTTNRETYLKDETGGRRFWPVLIGVIGLEALRRDRDQLFGEAVMRFKRGDHWWPSASFARESIAIEQEKRREPDPWEGPIAGYVDGTTLNATPLNRANITEIARLALGFDVMAKVGTADQRRIAAVLKTLRWRPGGRDHDGHFYERISQNVTQ